MRIVMCLALVLICVPVAWGQAILGFVGGSEYDSYYGSAAGDVVGWRFSVAVEMEISELGIWNADQTGGIDNPHELGIWDASQALLTSVTVDATGTMVGDWIYASTAPITVQPGITYTIGALYFSGDDDWYVSSATSQDVDADVTWLNSVYPAAAEMGFVYPELDSGSFGRYGPNFIFGPAALQHSTWGAIKASLY